MNVKYLRDVIKDLPDDTPVIVRSSHDHAMQFAHATTKTALQDGAWFTEDYGEELTPQKDYGERVNVVCIF